LATIVGVAEEVSESVVNRINDGSEIDTSRPDKPQRKKRNEMYLTLLQGKLNHLTQQEKQLIVPVHIKYAQVFRYEEDNELKVTDVTEHEILVSDKKCTRQPQYRTPYALRDEMRDQVQKMLDQDIIRGSNSPWSAPAILVPKKGPCGNRDSHFTWISEP
jgi:hypothetical protein